VLPGANKWRCLLPAGQRQPHLGRGLRSTCRWRGQVVGCIPVVLKKTGSGTGRPRLLGKQACSAGLLPLVQGCEARNGLGAEAQSPGANKRYGPVSPDLPSSPPRLAPMCLDQHVFHHQSITGGVTTSKLGAVCDAGTALLALTSWQAPSLQRKA
jgi:hypothetical protein